MSDLWEYMQDLLYTDIQAPYWEFGGHLYEHRWQDENIGFLKLTLTPRAIGDVLRRAVNHLVDQPDYRVAAEIQSDLPLCAETLATRCAELPIVLERVREPGRAPEWSS